MTDDRGQNFCPPSSVFCRLPLRCRETQQLDRFEVDDVAAGALGTAELDERRAGVGIAQNAHADPIDDRVAFLKVAERERITAGRDSWHIFAEGDREAEQGRRMALLQPGLPDIGLRGVFLKLTDL